MNTRLATLLVGISLSVLSLQTAAGAATIVESPDAGQTLGTAQSIGTVNAGDTVTGSVETDSDADLFGITLAGGFNWTITVTSPGGFTGISDSQLFLFDQTGNGVGFADDTTTINFLSTLGVTTAQQSTYYLGISGIGFAPQDSSSFIFPDSAPAGTTVGPNAGAGSLSTWAFNPNSGGGFTDFGSYTISFAATPVPEPSGLAGLFALASFGGFAFQKRNKSQKS